MKCIFCEKEIKTYFGRLKPHDFKKELSDEGVLFKGKWICLICWNKIIKEVKDKIKHDNT